MDDWNPQQIASHYSRFRVTERLLLTGHSHQAWPDVGFAAQGQAWLDAAELVDDKWSRAEEIAEEVRAGWRRLLNDPQGDIALAQNTHELVVRLLSAVLDPARSSPRARLVTTDGEFHTIRRQLDRLAESRVSIVKVASRPVDTLGERLAAAVDDTVACVLVSSVLFETAEIVPNLARVAHACAHHGAELLVDAYHHLNVVPFDLAAMGLARAFVVGGGYKYCQLGEGNAFLRVPPDTTLRPVITGWFSEFATLAETASRGRIAYGQGAARFAGATYDPTSHYRAAAVFAFHQQMGMTPERLRSVSRHQTSRLADAWRATGVDPQTAALVDVPAQGRAGFVALRTSAAGRLVPALRARGLYVDARGSTLRIGPAPYLVDRQLADAVELIREELQRSSNPKR